MSTTPSEKKINLLDFSREKLRAFFTERGEKPFRADQIIKWVHQKGVADIESMTNISKALRTELAEITEIRAPEIVLDQHSEDGTHKWLLRLDDGNCIEAVFIPERDRGTLCVSSQVGCALDCTFCSTARQGFNRNLTLAEIIGQLWLAERTLRPHPDAPRKVSNVVMMGMGEPLLNFEPVVDALQLMLDDFAYGLSKRRVTVSTSGVIPALDRLSQRVDVSLALSLHAANDELRNQLVPLNRKYPIVDLIAACKRFLATKTDQRSHITIEYVLLDGVNDRRQHAKDLIRVLEGLPVKVNLIPFNTFPGTRYQCSSPEQVERFQAWLMKSGLITVVRRTRGDDIDAACGQLAGKIQDKSRRERHFMKIEQGVDYLPSAS